MTPPQTPTPDQRATTGGAAHGAASRWDAAKAGAHPQPLAQLSVAQMAAPLLTLTGAQRGQGAAEWADTSGAAANRAWRRPGGLTRPAGL